MFLAETIQHDNFTELVLFGRDKDDKKTVTRVKNFRPYFYVDDSEKIPDDYRITGVVKGYKDLFNNPVKKVFIKRSKDLIGVRSLFDKHYEADINFAQRYIIDKLGEVPIYKLHTLSLDIETDSLDTFPDLNDPDQAIISCAFADNRGLRRKYIYVSPETTVKIKIDKNTRVFKTEEQLLEAIIAFIKQTDPDVLTGWNVIGFDFTYLINRMNKLNINPSAMSPMNRVFCNKDMREEEKYDITISGRIIIDGLEAYRHFRQISNQGRAEKYSLEFTAQDVLGIGKIPHTENFHEMWVNKPNELLDYNLRDAELVIDILEKLEIIDFFNYIRAKSMSQLSQIYMTTSLVDGFLLNYAHDKYVLPSKDKQDSDKYSGAFVFPPKPGLYENVIALDLKALYPNIIKTFNVGYETFNPEGEIKLDGSIGFDRGVGMMSTLMRTLEKERKVYKKLMWKADKAGDKSAYRLNYYKQYSVKVVMNSFYGYLGYPGSRLYKREVAEAITKWGQHIIFWTKKVLENNGYEVIYGDTDSVYVKSKSNGLFGLLKEGKAIVEKINKSYLKFTQNYGSDDCTLEMEFEKIFKKVLFVGKKGSAGEGAKKKYAYILLWEDNKTVTDKVKFTGFETVRSDTPRLTKETQTKVVEMLLNNASKKEVVDLLRNIHTNILNKTITTEEIAFPKGISKELDKYGVDKVNEETGVVRKGATPPVIRGARYANKYLGKRFSKGSKPKWIYIKKVPFGYPDTNVLSFEEEDIPKGFLIDYETMIEKILKMKLEEILLASGFGGFPNIDTRQQTL